MAQVIELQRRSKVLGHPSLPCMKRHYTVNLTAGCPNRCRYCYAQSMAHHPGWGRVHFYANSLQLLRGELAHMRRPPDMVFFSTCCEPFVPARQVLQSLYETMRMLLDVGSFILISTKCPIPGRFVDLFAGHRGRVYVQVGITTVDDAVRALLEPGAPSVEVRLHTLKALAAAGVPVAARMDPLIPGLTDTASAFVDLCAELAAHGVHSAVASHLFLRPAVEGTMRGLRIGQWHYETMQREFYTCSTSGFSAGSTIRLPSAGYRRDKLTELRRIAAEHAIALSSCRCVNADITSELCHPVPRPERRPRQTQLFR